LKEDAMTQITTRLFAPVRSYARRMKATHDAFRFAHFMYSLPEHVRKDIGWPDPGIDPTGGPIGGPTGDRAARGRGAPSGMKARGPDFVRPRGRLC
jgi:hypothetical protein